MEGAASRAHTLHINAHLRTESSPHMHDLMIASAFLAMLFFPCLAALRGDLPSDDVK